MSRILKRILLILLVILPIIVVSVLLNIKVIKYNGDSYYHLTKGSAISRIEMLLDSQKVELKGIGVCNLEDLGLDYKYSYLGLSGSVDLSDISYFYIKDEDKLYNYLDKLNDGLLDTENAYLEVTSNDIIFHSEVTGTKYDKDLVKSKVFDSISDGNLVIDISDCTIPTPSVTSDTYSKVLKNIEVLKKWKIEYTNGVCLDYKLILSCLDITSDGISFLVDNLEKVLNDYLTSSLDSYNTVGIDRDFKSTSGDSISLCTGTYGDKVDIDSEVDYIVSCLKDLKSDEDRVPILSLDLPDELTNTYIEVSLDKQHLWYYKDGVLVMDSDVVTGILGRADTPIGVYYISEKINGKYLTGDNYRTWVNYWLRLTNSGIGLHDANWRSKFGGSIYTYNGSHGCINLPKGFAKDLFNSVERKTAVIIY